jgi:hypothetical protein
LLLNGKIASVAKIFLRCASHYKYAMNTIIPTTIVDDFFEDPDSIRAFGLQQQYQRDEEGRWPGTRAFNLVQLNDQLFQHMCHRMLSIFWEVGNSPIHWAAHGTFQQVGKEYGEGWVHQDADSLITAIVYLTPDSDRSAGTSIYRRKNITVPLNPAYEEIKRRAYLSSQMATPEYLNARTGNNSLFEETVRVDNLYNRLLIFDSKLYHGVPAFDTGLPSRMTLTMFFSKIGTSALNPMQRMHRLVD